MSLLDAVRTAVLPAGLNLVAALPVARYDCEVPERFQLRNRYPDTQSIIVIGNGGGAFWRGFQRYCDEHPGHRPEHAHPLDEYTGTVIEREVPPLLARAGIRGRLLYPFRFEQDPVSFMHLGACAGLGARSLLGVLVNPIYGPWMALRAAVLLDTELEPTPISAFDPCGTCTDKPCISACPGGAVSLRGWDIPACTAHRLVAETNCAERCHARWECVYGRDQRYPADALAYHHGRAWAEMRKRHAA